MQGFHLFRGGSQSQKSAAPGDAPGAAAEINVLLCAGRRAGKTCIMSAMEQNMNNEFSSNTVSVTIKQLSAGGADPLSEYRNHQKDLFKSNGWDKIFYFAEESNQTGEDGESTATQETHLFSGEIRVTNSQGQSKLVNTISFRDPRGEDFSSDAPTARKNLVKDWIRSSQVLIIAIDTPRLMECDESGKIGAFHEAFNKPAEITDLIKQAWQGDTQQRLILFVPLKCELYLREGRGAEIVSRVQEGYKSLITYIRSSRAGTCSMAIVSCETMGGMEFRRFERLNGYHEGPEPAGGMAPSMFHSVYGFLRNEHGARFYKPKDCEQPLLYLMMFIFGLRKEGKTAGGLFASLKKMPEYEDLANAHREISSKCKRSEDEGYLILNDPQGYLNA